MSTPRRIVDLYIVGNQETDDTGRPKSQPTRLLRCESVLLRVHLLKADGTAYTDLPASLSFQYGLDSSYAVANTDPVASNNAKFVPSDWPGESGWNLAQGRFCARVSLKGSVLGAAMASKPELLAKHAVWATPPEDDAFPIFSVPVYVDNVTVEPGNIVEPDEPEAFVTVAMLASILQVPDGFQIYVEGGQIRLREITP